MKSSKVYFVLYIVLVVELLAVIQERDILQEMEEEIRDKMIVTIAEMYQKNIILSVPEKVSEYMRGSKASNKIQLNVVGLQSEKEKENIEMQINIQPGSKRPANWPMDGITLGYRSEDFNLYRDNGHIVFESKIKNSGSFSFVATCQVLRVLPDYLPEHLMSELITQIGEYNLNQDTNPEEFSIRVRNQSKFKEKDASWDL